MAYFPTNVLDNQIKALPTIASASGSVATFTTDKAENLVDCVCEVASGSSACNLVHYNENLFVSMPTATNDGITTSYDSNTGLISIRNDSRTTNYSYGSQRGIVASGLNPNHTYKFFFYPNVLGVTLYDTSSLAIPNPFTGYTTAVLRITNQYDFVNVHPIGDITTVKLFIFDITDGYGNTYNIQLGETLTDTAIYNAVTGVLTRNDTTTKQLDSCPIVTIANSENNIWSDTGDISVQFVLSVGSYVNQNT